MADNTLTLGAPSVRKEDAREGLDKKLNGVKFPLKVQAKNQFPFPLSLPNAGRLYLRPSGHKGDAAEVTMPDFDTFARFVTDVQAIASLHKTKDAVIVEWPDAPVPAQRKTPAAKSDSAAKAA